MSDEYEYDFAPVTRAPPLPTYEARETALGVLWEAYHERRRESDDPAAEARRREAFGVTSAELAAQIKSVITWLGQNCQPDYPGEDPELSIDR